MVSLEFLHDEINFDDNMVCYYDELPYKIKNVELIKWSGQKTICLKKNGLMVI